ncbi:hypothetical protein JMJ35_002842 [Cladonia borealis]|uniref:Uncharacterized protein n=1 Tax=Cladonia borealis TaxID=184061 RepID=A0AA39R3N1_9LECA|nr:hypothetical protein JMJ35_002842 [Cladonia borealis]
MADEDTIPDDNPQVKMPIEDSMADFIVPDGDSIHDDDPHIDWRTQVNTPIDIANDDDLSSVVSDPPTVGGFLDLDRRRPRELVEAETIRSNQPLGLPYAVFTAQSLTVDRIYESNDNLAIYAFSLVVYLWLVVCLRLQYDQTPEDRSVSSRMAAYFLAAHTVVKTIHGVTWQGLKFATQYWEERIANQGRGDSWLKDDDWYQDIPSLEEQPRSTDQVADVHLRILETEGKAELLKAIMDKEKDGLKTPLRDVVRNPATRANHEREILIMLASIDMHLLKAIIQGQVSRKAETPSDPV